MRLFGTLNRHREFIGHFATMMSGKSLAAMVALVATPIIARFFQPDDFGVAAVFMSVISIVSAVASLRYEAALVLPEKEDEANLLLAFTYRVLIAVCLGMLLLISILEISGLALPAAGILGVWIWVVPVGVLMMASLQIQAFWLTRQKAFKLLSVSLVTGSTCGSALRIAFGWLAGTSVYGLIIGNLFAMICRLVVQKTASREMFQSAFRRIGWPAMRHIASRYADFPKFNAPAGLVFILGQNLPVLLFGAMFGATVAGLYAMANRLANAPVTIVADSMRRVFLQKAAAVHNSGRSLQKAYLMSTGALAMLGLVPMVCVWLYGQPIAGWLLGERWLMAGRYLEIIAPWMFMVWVTAPGNAIFIVLRKQKLWLFVQTSLTLFRVGAFGLAYAISAGPEWALQAFVAATVVGNTVTIVVAVLLISLSAKRPEWRADQL